MENLTYMALTERKIYYDFTQKSACKAWIGTFPCHSLTACPETSSPHGHKIAAPVPHITSKHNNVQMTKIGHPTLNGFFFFL